MNQRWKPVGSTGRSGCQSGRDSSTGRSSRLKKPVKFSFFGTKKHLNTNQNILIFFILNKTFYKKLVLTNHTFRKHLLNGFNLWPLRHPHPETHLGWEYCAMPPTLGHGTNQKSTKYTLKLRNHILIKHACKRGFRYLRFSIILISLRSRSGADYRFFGTSCRFENLFST